MSFNGIKFESDDSDGPGNVSSSEQRVDSVSNFDAAEAAVAKLGIIMDEKSGELPSETMTLFYFV